MKANKKKIKTNHQTIKYVSAWILLPSYHILPVSIQRKDNKKKIEKKLVSKIVFLVCKAGLANQNIY